MVQLREFGVVGRGGTHLACPSDVGVHPRLDEGHEVGVTASKAEDLFDGSVRTIYVRDTHDRAWTMTRHAFRKLRAAYRAAAAASETARKQQELGDTRRWLGEITRDLPPNG